MVLFHDTNTGWSYCPSKNQAEVFVFCGFFLRGGGSLAYMWQLDNRSEFIEEEFAPDSKGEIKT